MRRSILALLLASSIALPAAAQSIARDPGDAARVRYEVAFPDAAHHRARITATWTNVPAGPLRVQMARSSPGRYAIHEFAKNVSDVRAVDGAGRPLPLTRNDPYGWSVAGHDGTVTVTYTLYADHGDGTYAQIDPSHAHLNMPATLMWASGYDAQPIRVRFAAPDPKWRVATQLPPVAGRSDTFWAPNLQYLMDSPTELSDHMVREWREGGQTYRLALHHLGSAADMDRYTEKAKRVVRAHIATFGAPAPYDFGTYTFIADYLPWATGDGMEHRNSTIITDVRSLAAADDEQIGTLSHEFFHSWNVERIRPAELEPFDFTRANPTPSLWLAEGFTQYYGPLAIRRAGVMSVDDYLDQLGPTLSGIVTSPARLPARINASPQEMSLRAPFVDSARAIDPVDPTIFVSYYPYGAVIGLALDLELRQRFPGKSLDDYMRLLWRTHGAPERPYRPNDLRVALATLTGNTAFADRFFAQTIRGSALPDFAPLLAQAGLVLRPVSGTPGWIGRSAATAENGGVTLAQSPAPNTPLYAAGVDRGDTIVALGTTTIGDVAGWTTALATLRPGAAVPIRYRRRGGQEITATLTPAADPTLEIVRGETIGQTLTPAQRAFRTAWLGQ
ncbi:M61 family metallopeptidase [Sphingomonas sp. Leaf25]|uniref:M61 family metallopeptidase n=1 Tax=Sphingomonas sp. Leaf25 TaxID=1735692 RepID=UPI0006F430B6|nr:PDZ domain-containing protein [Sphingomonas sp. Leaf25]KQM96816.1 peptidase M61 [Sphingomonas sp. Leaf25]